MARKDRAPDPPKRPQAPQRRSTPVSAAGAARRRRLLYVLAASGLVALAVVLGVLLLRGGGTDEEDLAATMKTAGCDFKREVAAGAREHSAQLDATSDPKWRTDPPTSGPHYQVPAVYGSYTEQVNIAQIVHNLEHGAMFVLYGPRIPEGARKQIEDFYAEDPRGIIVSPYPKLGDKIALGAWNVPREAPEASGSAFLATCPNYDEDAFKAFRDELRFRGPEPFPPDSLQPGST